jgi:Tfp pilus assembly protein PilF
MPLKPEGANIRFNYGTALFNAEKYQDAAGQYREAVRINLAFAHAHSNLGMALLRNNDTKSVQAEFAEAHRLDRNLSPLIPSK